MGPSELSLLFVEDDEKVRALIAEFLKSFSFKNVYLAKDGKEGLQLYKQYKPHLILTDLTMPVMNGLEMSREIKSIDATIPILLITSHFEKEVTEAAVDIGIDSYLFKPISLERLEMILQKYINSIVSQRKSFNQHKFLEEYKKAIDISTCVTKMDTNRVITYANDLFCKMSGYSKSELIGQHCSIMKHPSTANSTYLEMWRIITNKQVWQGRMQNLKKNGETYYEYTVIVPIINGRDEIEEYIALRQDITDLFHQEQHLKKRVEYEVGKNLKFHKELEQERLLEERFSVIGKMAAGITHEINTPLTYIKGNLELMMRDISSLDKNLKQRAYLLEDSKSVFEGINRIASIVESMREMASQSKEMPQENNLYACLITALTLAYSKAKQISQIRVQNQIFKIGMHKERFHFGAIFQKQRIEQVLIIIINNALDALVHKEDFNSRLLDINIENEREFIVIRIKDNGGGIAEDILPRIFDPFQSNKEEGGMGIGLNVAKRIMDDHGGKIIPSNCDEGALFEVYIPKKIFSPINTQPIDKPYSEWNV